MNPSRYQTDAPGVGSYRFQSEFGVYSASDIYNQIYGGDQMMIKAPSAKDFLNIPTSDNEE